MHTRECDAASRDTGGKGVRPLSQGPPSCSVEAQTCSRRTLTTMRDLSVRVQESWHHCGHLMGGAQSRPASTGFSQPRGVQPRSTQTPASSRLPWSSAPPSPVSPHRVSGSAGASALQRSPEGQDRVLVLPCLSQRLHSRPTCESGGAHPEKRLQLPSARDLFSSSDLQFVSEGCSLQWE